MNEINIKDSLKITPMQVGGDATKVQLILNGYLDTYNSPEFQNHINNLIESGARHIIFNCNGLNYISSTGIGAFTSFLKILKQRKGDMVLYGLQKKVLEVFQLLGFTKFFKISETLDDGLSMLEGKVSAQTKEEGAEAVEELGLDEVSTFPLVFECPHCAKKLRTSKPGKFRCSGCKGLIAVDERGAVRAS
jgi:anti-sigma B factor antagonist